MYLEKFRVHPGHAGMKIGPSPNSAVDGFQTRLRSGEKYTHRSKG